MLLGDDIATIATVIEAIVLVPVLLEFLIEHRKRKHAADLTLEVVDVKDLDVQLAGMDELLFDIRDLIDRARHPKDYEELKLGNEILIAGPPLSGKKALAKRIAKEAAFDSIIIVHNPRNIDALTRAKQMVMKAAKKRKTMLLLPRLDLIDESGDEDLLVELDAVIETTSDLSHALVIGTTNKLIAGGEIDHLFGVTLSLPGTAVVLGPEEPLQLDVHRMLAGVAEFYLDNAIKEGYRLTETSRDGFVARILLSVTNGAQIEDIVVLCQTAAIYRQRMAGKGAERVISPDMLELALRRVVSGT